MPDEMDLLLLAADVLQVPVDPDGPTTARRVRRIGPLSVAFDLRAAVVGCDAAGLAVLVHYRGELWGLLRVSPRAEATLEFHRVSPGRARGRGPADVRAADLDEMLGPPATRWSLTDGGWRAC